MQTIPKDGLQGAARDRRTYQSRRRGGSGRRRKGVKNWEKARACREPAAVGVAWKCSSRIWRKSKSARSVPGGEDCR